MFFGFALCLHLKVASTMVCARLSHSNQERNKLWKTTSFLILFCFFFFKYQKVGKGLCRSVGPETTCIFLKSYPLLVLN